MVLLPLAEIKIVNMLVYNLAEFFYEYLYKYLLLKNQNMIYNIEHSLL